MTVYCHAVPQEILMVQWKGQYYITNNTQSYACCNRALGKANLDQPWSIKSCWRNLREMQFSPFLINYFSEVAFVLNFHHSVGIKSKDRNALKTKQCWCSHLLSTSYVVPVVPILAASDKLLWKSCFQFQRMAVCVLDVYLRFSALFRPVYRI